MFPIFPSLIVNVPLMHQELLGADLPVGVLTLWPGLPPSDKGHVCCPSMPYTEAEAAACLADLARLGQDGLGAMPAQAVASLQRQDRKRQLGAGEASALTDFARGGALSQGAEVQQSVETWQRRAQRLLLLAWLQEERVLDLRRLLARYNSGAAALAARLGEAGEEAEQGDISQAGGLMDCLPVDVDEALPPWRFVLEQMAIFLPEEAALFSADARMMEDLCPAECCTEELRTEEACAEKTGEAACLQPYWRSVPDPSVLPAGWDASLISSLRVLEAPLWRILGLAGPQPGKPWLDASRFVVMYSKAGKRPGQQGVKA